MLPWLARSELERGWVAHQAHPALAAVGCAETKGHYSILLKRYRGGY